MNPFLLPSQERLEHWKQFRRALGLLEEVEQLESVATYWANAPLKSIAYDIERPSDWPTPWQMVHAGEWCRNSTAIGMEATLRLAGWAPQRMTLMYLIDQQKSDMILVLNIDKRWLLNYDWGSLRPMTNGLRILRSFCWMGRKHEALEI